MSYEASTLILTMTGHCTQGKSFDTVFLAEYWTARWITNSLMRCKSYEGLHLYKPLPRSSLKQTRHSVLLEYSRFEILYYQYLQHRYPTQDFSKSINEQSDEYMEALAAWNRINKTGKLRRTIS